MKSFTTTLTLLLPSLAAAAYTLADNYDASNFFTEFDAFTGSDPTHGFVQFLDMSTAQSTGLYTAGKTVKLAVEAQQQQPNGRPGVRVTSKKSYNTGLFIADIAHMPGSICGTWPAYWLVGPNWPSAGEIDIIEGVNSDSVNQMTLHTNSQSCSVGNKNFAGNVVTSDCNVAAAGQADNAGCGIQAAAANSYGDGFNSAGGGVYAMEWTSSSIQVWFFSRGAIPADISSGSPDPSTWGEPQAGYNSCNIGSAFSDQQIVIDTTFCGDWAGNVWSSDPVCGSKAPDCKTFVANNPTAFAEAYWEFNSIKVYSGSGSSSGGSTPASAAPSGSSPSASPAGNGGDQGSESPAPSSVAQKQHHHTRNHRAVPTA